MLDTDPDGAAVAPAVGSSLACPGAAPAAALNSAASATPAVAVAVVPAAESPLPCPGAAPSAGPPLFSSAAVGSAAAVAVALEWPAPAPAAAAACWGLSFRYWSKPHALADKAHVALLSSFPMWMAHLPLQGESSREWAECRP